MTFLTDTAGGRLARTCTFALALLALALTLTPLAFAPAAQAQEQCIQVITFAEDPETGECVAFPTPCDVPEGWEECDGETVIASTQDLPEAEPAIQVPAAEQQSHEPCIQVITYGKHPGTGECEAFPTPCDVPQGWESFSTLEECEAAC